MYGSTVNSTAVYSININHNNARGTLPSLAGLSQLAFLECATGALSGSIPSSIGGVTTLQVFRASTKKFSGTLPPFLYQLTALNRLEIFENPKLSGTIDNALSQLTSMSRLRMYSCPLSGYIPLGVSSLTALASLIGYDLQVSGHVPDVFSTASSLYYIMLTGTKTHSHLSGTIEGVLSQFESLSSLSVLYMQQAKFSGTLHSDSDTAHKAVTLMSFSENRISGVLPTKFSKYSRLQIMNWDSNVGTSGTIPSTFGSLTVLQQIFMKNCTISGTLPSTLGNARLLTLIDLDLNRLSGSSSPEFRSWTKLVLIALSKNPIDWDLSLIRHWKRIQFCLLKDMAITGTLPVKMLKNNNMLQHLHISFNQISGTISEQAFKNAIYSCRI